MPPRFAAAAVLACASLLPATVAFAGAGIEPIETVRIATGISRPVFVTHAPGDYTRLFILEQHTGRIEILNSKTLAFNPDPFLDLSGLALGNEQGLLGLAFHPDYQNNREFFVYYTASSGGATVIAKYLRSVNNPDIANANGDTIMTFNQPFSNHNGGWIGFDPTQPEGTGSYLHIATGDGGSFCDPQERAQNLSLMLGKMLRIDVDGDDFPTDDLKDYAIPPSNPFAGGGGNGEIWHYGLRNPWRDSFDRETGELYMGDVGQDAREEISYQPAGSPGGLNYGWDCKEGFSCSNIFPSNCSLVDTCSCTDPTLTDPIHDYAQTGGSCSVTGGYVYRGCAIPTLRGTYIFGDYCSARIWSFQGPTVLNFTDRTAELAPDVGSIGLITSFGEDARGEIYICDQGGEIFKIIPSSPTIKPTDYDCDGDVDVNDLLFLLAGWGDCDGCLQDLDGDHIVDISELLQLLAEWG